MKISEDQILSGYCCPVCGFTMATPAADFHICPSCGTEFGNDDVDWTFEQLRAAWLENGARWWSNTQPPPVEWNPVEQILCVIEIASAPDLESNTIMEDELNIFEISPAEWGSWRATGSKVEPCLV